MRFRPARVSIWGFLLLFLALPLWAQEEPLPPEEAFPARLYAADPHTLRLEFDVTDGYYLYRDKFAFQALTPGLALGEPRIPRGKVKEDEFFGQVETLRHRVAIDLPIAQRPADADRVEIEVRFQGCADMGVCYPPMKRTLAAHLLPVGATAEASAPPQEKPGLLERLGATLGLGGGEDEVLPPDQVFVFSARAEDERTILAHWKILDGYYLYREKFRFSLQDPPPGVSLSEPRFPKGEMKTDEAFGRMEVYHDAVEIRIPVNRPAGEALELTLVAEYQGCAERGLCYPPQKKTTPILLPAASTAVTAPPPMATSAAPTAAPPMAEQDRIAQSLADSSIWVIIATFYGFGLLLAFTPCVFPMIPILSGIIVGQGEGLTTRRAFVLSLVYVLAMALTYTVAGVVAGLFGANLQAAFQNPWVLGTFALVFILLALSMFGFYDLQLPASWQTKLSEAANKQKGGTLTGVAVMGLLSALIVGPCVAAPLAGALIYIGQTGDAVLGGIALFALSMGMGTPLLLLGTSAGKLLPKAGPWMDTIKAVFGVLLLAVAVWMLERIVPEWVAMSLWAAILIVSSIYMGAFDRMEQGVSGWRRLWKGLGLILFIYGALLLVGVSAGAKDPLRPLQGLALGTGTAQAPAELQFQKITTPAELDRLLAQARQEGRPVMVDFYADWCISCKEMERYTFSDPGVQAVLSRALLVKADVTANDDPAKALMQRYGIIGPPAILFFGPDGQERRAYRLVGFLEADEFRDHARRALRG